MRVHSSLGNTAAVGAVWSIGGQAISLAIFFVSMAVLARLISPEAFGVVAMVTAIVGLGELVRDFGLTNAVVQAPTISDRESSNLFWLNVAIGLTLTILLFVASGPIADFYNTPDIKYVVQVLSLTFLVNGIATQPRATLIRNLRTRSVALTDVASAIVGLIVSVVMALAGYGYWAIVGLQLGRYVATMLISVASAKFRPRMPSRSPSIMHFIRFGIGLFGARILVYISMNLDTVLIGRVLGAQQLGLYSRAYQLALMPTSQMASPMSRVALPMLSRLRDDPSRYDAFLLRAQTIMTMVTAAGYCVVIVFADLVIRVALGPGWGESILIFQILCVVGLVDAANNVTYWIFVSKGIPYQHLTYSLINRPILIVSIAMAVPHGIVVVAWTFVAWITLAWPLGVFWANRKVEIPVRPLLLNGVRVMSLFALVTAVGIGARWYPSFDSDIVPIFISVITMIFTFIGIYLAWPGVRRDVKSTLGVVTLLRQSRTVLPVDTTQAAVDS